MKDATLEKELLSAYDAYADDIFRHCYFKTGERELAQDMTQDVFLKVWSYMQGGKPVQNMRALLYRIAGNLVIDWYRKKKSQSLDALMEQGIEPADPVSRVEGEAEANLALKVLQRLEPADQQLITWRFVDDLSPPEIAEILKESENTISVRLHRALKRLRALLQ